MERPIPGSRLSDLSSPEVVPAAPEVPIARRFADEMLAPARSLPTMKQDPSGASIRFDALAKSAARWEKDLRKAFTGYAARLAASTDPAVREAIRKFDELPRWKRVESILLGGPESLLENLDRQHRVELMAVSGREAKAVWAPGKDGPGRNLKALPLEPAGVSTDLSDGILGRVKEGGEDRTVAVLFSDGQHNEGSSPLAMAQVLGGRKIPLHTIALGGAEHPYDLALLKVAGPETVFFKDRVRGEIILKDDMPAGRPFNLNIEGEGGVLWEKALVTEQVHRRTIPFDFPVQAIAERLSSRQDSDLRVLSLPLRMKVTVTPAEGEKEKQNNEGELLVRAIMHRRRMLILEGRPRWEHRYLRNMFERDEQWEVSSVMADAGAGGGWTRGRAAGQFPPDRESLFAFDLIVLGEVPRQHTRREEQEWIRDFVGKRGGALIAIDGARAHMAGYADTPLGPLLPVDWKADPPGGKPSALRLTESGARAAAFHLASEDGTNRGIWAALPPPHGLVPSRALPGSETLLEAMVGERAFPAVVFRRYQGGRVLYAAFDESWRWRYEAGDRHHVRYWNQVAQWIMEAPFAVRDKFVSLDVGRLNYAVGETAEFRVRLRDAAGKPLERADAEAVLFKDGVKSATVKLTAVEDSGGLFRGKTGELAEGRYEVQVRAPELPEAEMKAKVEFSTRPRERETGELDDPNCDEELLRQMSAQSGGEFFREEEADALASRLEPLSRERVIEADTMLWQSWWWFVPLVGILAAEWVVRKWKGML